MSIETIATLSIGNGIPFGKETEYRKKEENTFSNDGLLLVISYRRSESV